MIGKRINQLEESKSGDNSRRILENEFGKFDDITVLCYTKWLEISGVVFGWGGNSHGQLTDQVANTRQTLPTEITKFGTVTNVAAGSGASFVVKGTAVFAVGDNFRSQLGLGESEISLGSILNGESDKVLAPSKVELQTPIRSLASKNFSSFALDTSGRIVSWGSNEFNKLGRNYEFLAGGTPQIIDTLRNYKVKQVASGDSHACCLTTDGEVFTWGNRDPKAGLSSHDSPQFEVPTKLNIEKISQISCGWSHTLLLSADHKTVWAVGENCYGQLGHNPHFRRSRVYERYGRQGPLIRRMVHIDGETRTKVPIKVPFSGDKVITKLQCYGYDSAILSADGEIRVFGRTWNPAGDRGTPRTINIGQVVDMSMGEGFMLALTAENRLYAFGRNSSGQCGQGYTSPFIDEPVEVENLHNLRIEQISTGYNHCLIKCTKLKSCTQF